MFEFHDGWSTQSEVAIPVPLGPSGHHQESGVSLARREISDASKNDLLCLRKGWNPLAIRAVAKSVRVKCLSQRQMYALWTFMYLTLARTWCRALSV